MRPLKMCLLKMRPLKMSISNVLKTKIAKLFRIPMTWMVMCERDGKKILVLVRTNWKETKKTIFSIEHLLNEDYQVTEQTLEREEKIFSLKISSST